MSISPRSLPQGFSILCERAWTRAWQEIEEEVEDDLAAFTAGRHARGGFRRLREYLALLEAVLAAVPPERLNGARRHRAQERPRPRRNPASWATGHPLRVSSSSSSRGASAPRG